jgi:predicted ATPase
MIPARINRVRLLSYRSIDSCDVELPDLAFLVGPNGSGKSNFLDALGLVSEALQAGSLAHALRTRGGVGQVATRPYKVEQTVGLQFDVSLAGGSAEYAFVFTPRGSSRLVVEERCKVRPTDGSPERYFDVRRGEVTTSEAALPDPGSGRLYLTGAASQPVFEPVYDLLSSMSFYDFSVSAIKEPRPPDLGDRLATDGSNLASVLGRMKAEGRLHDAIVQYLGVITPGVEDVGSTDRDGFVTLSVTQERDRVPFSAQSVSDGTLRALAVLTAAFQDAPGLVGIEEPEIGVHPAAAGVLREALLEASGSRQILATSHSPELLDDPDLPVESVIAVQATGGVTRLGPLDQAGRMALRERLYTAGELLRLDQLVPDGGA